MLIIRFSFHVDQTRVPGAVKQHWLLRCHVLYCNAFLISFLFIILSRFKLIQISAFLTHTISSSLINSEYVDLYWLLIEKCCEFKFVLKPLLSFISVYLCNLFFPPYNLLRSLWSCNPDHSGSSFLPSFSDGQILSSEMSSLNLCLPEIGSCVLNDSWVTVSILFHFVHLRHFYHTQYGQYIFKYCYYLSRVDGHRVGLTLMDIVWVWDQKIPVNFSHNFSFVHPHSLCQSTYHFPSTLLPLP